MKQEADRPLGDAPCSGSDSIRIKATSGIVTREMVARDCAKRGWVIGQEIEVYIEDPNGNLYPVRSRWERVPDGMYILSAKSMEQHRAEHIASGGTIGLE